MTFTRKGIDFPSLEDRVHTFETGISVLGKANYIHICPDRFLIHSRVSAFTYYLQARPRTNNSMYSYINIIVYLYTKELIYVYI